VSIRNVVFPGNCLANAVNAACSVPKASMNEWMGHSPGRGQPVPARSFGVARSAEARDRRGARYCHAGIDALGAAEGEVGELGRAGCQYAACGLGRHAGLERDVIEQRRLHELRLRRRRRDFQERLAGEDGSALGHGPDIAGES
jgi:hypothetical protein